MKEGNKSNSPKKENVTKITTLFEWEIEPLDWEIELTTWEIEPLDWEIELTTWEIEALDWD